MSIGRKLASAPDWRPGTGGHIGPFAQKTISLPFRRADNTPPGPDLLAFSGAHRLLGYWQGGGGRVPGLTSVWTESCRPGAILPGARRDKNPGGLDRQDWHR